MHHISIKLDKKQLQRLQDASSDMWSDDERSKKNRCSGTYKHVSTIYRLHYVALNPLQICARCLLIATFCLSVASLFVFPLDEHRDLKVVASVLDICTVFLALIGNLKNCRLIYWPFFIVHVSPYVPFNCFRLGHLHWNSKRFDVFSSCYNRAICV